MPEPAFEVVEPRGVSIPLLISAPHSGTVLPPDIARRLLIDPRTAASLDDGPVHRLFEDAPVLGATLLVARYRRACVDLNRDPCEMAPDALTALPAGLAPRISARARAGLGVVPTRVGTLRLYRTPLSTREFAERLHRFWEPYHRELQRRLARLVRRFGTALLLDVHSMPTSAAVEGGRTVDVCLGDGFGRTAHPAPVRATFEQFVRAGLQVSRNAPFAGGFVTRHYGRPEQGVHALQLEFRRALFLHERTLEPHAGLELLRRQCRALVERLVPVLEELRVASAA